ncbi:MAG: LysE family translocator [Pseudomonadota bacterium]
MLTTEALVAFTLIFLLDSISPGPAVAAVVARAATSGTARTVAFIAGLVVGDLALFAAAVAGLTALAAAFGAFFFLVKWCGIAYLLYLAWKLWRAPVAIQIERRRDGAMPSTGLKTFALATALPLGNPKAIGFYVALLPAILDPTALAIADCAVLAVVITVIWFGTLYAYAVAGDRAGRAMQTPRARRLLNRTSAVGLTGAATAIAIQN